ncbi:MAG: DUF4870 domain-containing protein [Saprospiraceae bacterium]|nr:DUF4870 domain-containing protein [Saprospiraceae bacterium]
MNEEQEEFKKLRSLKEKGVLTDKEFELEKQKLFEAHKDDDSKPTYLSFSDKDFLMYMHLSCIIGVFFPVIGFLVPYVIWKNNQEHEETNKHGVVLFNWCASFFIYALSSVFTCIILFELGLFLIVLVTSSFIGFCVYGGIQANMGVLYHYPFTFTFIEGDKN